MPTDRDALLLQVSADIRSIQKSMARMNGEIDSGFDKAERRAGFAVRSIEKSLGNIKLPKALAKDLEGIGYDIGRGLSRGSQAAQVALAGISAYAIKLAADAGEIESAFDVAFKTSAASARAFADELGERVGRDAVVLREQMTRLQLVLTGTGVAADQAAEMVKKLTTAGVDAGSLFNTTDAEALQKIISGITGESEPLKAFGVVITEAAVQTELLSLGLKGNAKDATEAQKAVARTSLIMKGLAVAQGDAERTSDSAANTTRRMTAEFNKAARDLGQQLLPAFTKAASGATDLLKAFNDMPGAVQVGSLAILAFIAAGGPIASLVGGLARVIKVARDAQLAIAGVAAANGAAGAAGGLGVAAGLAGAGTVGAGLAGGLAIGATIKTRGDYDATNRARMVASDAQLAAAKGYAEANIRALERSGGTVGRGKERLDAFKADLEKLDAEVFRRGQAVAKAATEAANGSGAGAYTLPPGSAGGSTKPKGRTKKDSGPTAEELARTRQLAELQERIELAQAAQDVSWTQALQDQADRLQKIAAYRREGLDIAESTAKADAFMADKVFYRTQAAARDPAGLVSNDDLLGGLRDALADIDAAANDTPLNDYLASLQDIGAQIEGETIYAFASLHDSLARTAAQALGLKGPLASLFSTIVSLLTQNNTKGLLTSLVGGAKLAGFASGTNSAPGGWARINERGPEGVAYLPKGAQVIPNDVMRGLANMQVQPGAQKTVTLNMNIDLTGANGDETIARIAYQAASQGAMTAYAGAMRDAPGKVSRSLARRYR